MLRREVSKAVKGPTGAEPRRRSLDWPGIDPTTSRSIRLRVEIALHRGDLAAAAQALAAVPDSVPESASAHRPPWPDPEGAVPRP